MCCASGHGHSECMHICVHVRVDSSWIVDGEMALRHKLSLQERVKVIKHAGGPTLPATLATDEAKESQGGTSALADGPARGHLQVILTILQIFMCV